MKKILQIAIAITPFILQAQDSTTLLKNIIISENRLQIPFSNTSRSIEILTKKDIQAAPVQSIAELLNYVAGVDVRQRGVHGVQPDVTMRGSTFDQTLILINGIKLIDPQTGHHSLNLPVNIANIERIEVLKGAAARIYGQNAMAGAINIITKPDTEGGASVTLQAGDYGLWGGQLVGSLPIKDKIAQTVSLSYNTSQGYRPNSDYKIGTVFYQNQTKIGQNNLNIIGGYTDRKFGASGFYNSTNTSNERENIQTNFIAADMPLSKDNWTITPRLSWRRNQDEYFFDYSTDATRAATRNFTLTQVVNAEINSRFESSLGSTGIGVEYNSSQFFNKHLGDHSRSLLSAYIEHRFHFFNEKLDVTPGIMLAQYSDFGFNAFPGVDLGIRLTEKIKLFGNFGKTYRVPTFTDLYFFNAANKNNPDLKPEKADVFEAGAKYIDEHWTIQASYFQRNAQDMIDRTKNLPTEAWTPTNLNSLILRGGDFSAAYRFAALKGGKIQVSYINLDNFTFTKAQALSRYALDFLTDQFSASIESGIFGKLRHNIRVRSNKRLNQAEQYTVVDAKLIWQDTKWAIFAQASNIFDENFTEQNNIPMPKRWFSAGLTVKL